jgi:dienelactone hydrolase
LAEPASYEPKGKVIQLTELHAYVVGSHENGKAVIMGGDIYGNEAGRTKEVADRIADAGFFVILPDFLKGQRWTAELEASSLDKKMSFIKGLSNPDDILRDITEQILPYLRNECHITDNIGFVGFCFGGYVAYLASQVSGLLRCAIGVHSSIRIFNMHGSNEQEATMKVTCPQMLLQASNDNLSGKPGSDVQDILASKPFGEQCVLREFPDMLHGWVLRGDVSVPAVARDVQIAFQLILEFLYAHVK